MIFNTKGKEVSYHNGKCAKGAVSKGKCVDYYDNSYYGYDWYGKGRKEYKVGKFIMDTTNMDMDINK